MYVLVLLEELELQAQDVWQDLAKLKNLNSSCYFNSCLSLVLSRVVRLYLLRRSTCSMPWDIIRRSEQRVRGAMHKGVTVTSVFCKG